MARLDHSQKRELCWLIAAREATPKILEHFLGKYSIEISAQQVYSYKNGLNSKDWPKLIADFRAQYDAAVEECHFSSKRNRLNALYHAYLKADEKGDQRAMVMAVAQAQKEMEGTKVELTGKDGKDFSFNINIGPPPEQRQVGPPVKVLQLVE